jgi:hypothetical protein
MSRGGLYAAYAAVEGEQLVEQQSKNTSSKNKLPHAQAVSLQRRSSIGGQVAYFKCKRTPGVTTMTMTLDYHRQRNKKLHAEVCKLRTELKDARRAGYEEGAKATMLSTYLAIQDYGIPGIEWLTERHRAVAKKRPPPNTAIDEAVTLAVIEHMRGYDPARAAQIGTAFAEFLGGDSK